MWTVGTISSPCRVWSSSRPTTKSRLTRTPNRRFPPPKGAQTGQNPQPDKGIVYRNGALLPRVTGSTMTIPKYRAAFLVFFVGFALGLSVFVASRLFVRSVLDSDA